MKLDIKYFDIFDVFECCSMKLCLCFSWIQQESCNLLQYLTWKLFWFQIVNCPDSWCNARPISDPHVNNVKMFVSPCELLRYCSEKYTTKIHNIQQICINNPGNIRGLSHFRHTIKCNEHIHSRYFHTECIWYFYSSSPHNDSIFLNCICWI